MQIQLKEMVKAARPKMKTLVLRPIQTTRSQELDLTKVYLDTVRVWEAGRAEIMVAYAADLPTMTDAAITRDFMGSVRTAIEVVSVRASERRSLFTRAYKNFGAKVVRRHIASIVASLKYSTGIDLSTTLTPSDVEETVEMLLARNVALIKDVSDQTQAKIMDAVLRGLQARTPPREVAEQIQMITGFSRKRSIRIASDQAVKMNSALDRERLTQLGFTEIIWNHSDKKYFRPEHKARDGKVYKFTDPIMKTDPPGHAIYCGCTSQGKMDL